MISLTHKFTSFIQNSQILLQKTTQVQCDACDSWLHVKCTDMTPDQVQYLNNPHASYLCNSCLSVWNDRLVPLLQSVDMLRDEKTSNWQIKRRRFLRRKNIQHHCAVRSCTADTSLGRTVKPYGHSYKELSTIFEHRGFESSLPIWAQRSIVREQVLASSLPSELSNAQQVLDNDDDDDEKDVTSKEAKESVTATSITKIAIGDDKRQCVMCLKFGDRDNFCEGRLLVVSRNSSDTADWIHVNCALWASECHEDKNGNICNVGKAISRGARLKCSFCSRSGASVGCCHPLCKDTYHIECAIKSGCFLNATVFCMKHRKDKDIQQRFLLDGTN